MSQSKPNVLKAVGLASKDEFVLEALTTINKIINLDYVPGVYAKSIAKVQQALKTLLQVSR
jgi:hypothetical protein